MFGPSTGLHAVLGTFEAVSDLVFTMVRSGDPEDVEAHGTWFK